MSQLTAAVWIAHIGVGIIAALIFRHFQYRRAWAERRLRATLPLAFLTALSAGIALAFLVHLPAEAMDGEPFAMFEGWQTVSVSGGFSYAMNRVVALTILYFPALLAYWAVSSALHARKLAFKSLALENSLKDARLGALSAQLNPHFLFNALNDIRFMISRDADRAEESLVALSEILRHSLESSRNDKVPLARELAITERYLSLMKNQMGRRLEYVIQGSPDSANCLMPPMIIQMLAENAIRHGVERIAEGGRVDIDCSANGEALRIDVRNSAPPPGSDRCASVRKSLAAAAAEDDAGEGGVGLSNIRKRLSLLFGEAAGIGISRRDDEFQVTIELPCEKAG